MELFSIPLALIAGLFSILSPCVLPLVPIVLGVVVSEHRYGPAALAGGLALSFTAIGMFVATVGYAVGLDGEVFRNVAAVLLVGVGAVLVVPEWQAQVALAAGPIGNWTQKFGNVKSEGQWGQFGVGVLLGAVWSPCVMFAFGIGSALPLLTARHSVARNLDALASPHAFVRQSRQGRPRRRAHCQRLADPVWSR